MEESTKRIVDNLQRNMEKYIDDVFSPIFSSIKLELKEMEDKLDEEENQADLMEEEEVPEDIHAGEELQPATISIGEEIPKCEQNFCSVISSFSGGAMVEKFGGESREGAGGSRGEFAGGFTEGGQGDCTSETGGVPFASGVNGDFESSRLRYKTGGFVGGLYGVIFERGGAGCCGSGGGPGGCVENCSGGGMFGFRTKKSSNQGPRIMVSGFRSDNSGDGKFGGGGNIEHAGGSDFSCDLLQKTLEEGEYGRSFTDLGKKIILEDASKGNIVNEQKVDKGSNNKMTALLLESRSAQKEGSQQANPIKIGTGC